MRRLINPFTEPHRLRVHQGTRLLIDDAGLLGKTFTDETGNDWQIIGVYAPLPGRKISGIRARVIDDDDYTSFINQRDLEVLLGIGKPGSRCNWTGEAYPSHESPEWVGVFCDDDDSLDDLNAREMELLSMNQLHEGSTIQRKIHVTNKRRFEEYFILIPSWAARYPVLTYNTVMQRWSRAERLRTR